jgi:hypothetical protein
MGVKGHYPCEGEEPLLLGDKGVNKERKEEKEEAILAHF